MYDVEGLEKEWKKYKVIQRKPWIISAMLVSLILLFIVYKAQFSSMVSGYSNDMNQSVVKQKIEDKNTSLEPYVPTLVEAKEESNQSFQEKPSLQGSVESNLSIEENESVPSMMVEVPEEEMQPEPEHQRKYLKIIVTDMYPKHQEKSKKSIQPKREKSTVKTKER